MHKVVENHLEAYLDGSLLPAAKREVESHLDGCRACRQEIQEFHEAEGLMRLLVLDQPVAPAPGFYQRVRGRVEEEAARRAVWPFWQLFPVPSVSRQFGYALTMLVLLLGTYFFTLQHAELTAPTAMRAEILLEPPVIQNETPRLTADAHTNRERVMRAIVLPISAEGD